MPTYTAIKERIDSGQSLPRALCGVALAAVILPITLFMTISGCGFKGADAATAIVERAAQAAASAAATSVREALRDVESSVASRLAATEAVVQDRCNNVERVLGARLDALEASLARLA